MSRIVSHTLITPDLVGQDACFSSAQLQLDTAYSDFSSQTADFSSIASYTLTGLVGQVGRVGLLRLFGRSGVLQNFISHLGSIGAEAGTFSLIQGGNFASHFVNFATFRVVGAACRTHNPISQHFTQSAAMLAGHQVAGVLHLEEGSDENFSSQFFHASLSTLQIQVGNSLAHFLGGGRMRVLEKHLHYAARGNSCKRLSSLVPKESALVSMSAERQAGFWGRLFNWRQKNKTGLEDVSTLPPSDEIFPQRVARQKLAVQVETAINQRMPIAVLTPHRRISMPEGTVILTSEFKAEETASTVRVKLLADREGWIWEVQDRENLPTQILEGLDLLSLPPSLQNRPIYQLWKKNQEASPTGRALNRLLWNLNPLIEEQTGYANNPLNLVMKEECLIRALVLNGLPYYLEIIDQAPRIGYRDYTERYVEFKLHTDFPQTTYPIGVLQFRAKVAKNNQMTVSVHILLEQGTPIVPDILEIFAWLNQI